MIRELRKLLLWLLLCLIITPNMFLINFTVLANEIGAAIVVPTEDYPTIQAAIDAADIGDTIFVMPGMYRESLTITKPVELIGSGVNSTIIKGDGAKHTVHVESVNGFVFSGFTVEGKNYSMSGIYVKRGANNCIENVTVTGHLYGVHIYDSGGNTLRNCNVTDNKYNLRIWGLYLSHFLNDIDSSNLVNGKPVCYWINQQNMTVPQGVGYVALINCSNIVVKNLDLSNNLAGVQLVYTSNSLIKNMVASENERGLYLISSHNNLIVNSSFLNNYWSGISTISSANNSIVGNVLSNNTWQGIRLSHSDYLLSTYSDTNLVLGNFVSNNYDGIYFEKSNNNTVSGNVVENTKRYAIVFDQSHGNLLYKNTIKYNKCGVRVDRSNNNVLYHNAFLNNTVQTSVYEYLPSKNTWDNGYPSGGNYWSDYTGFDENSGADQDLLGSDGIGDIPYFIDADNIDRYPLCELPPQNELPNAQFYYEPWDPRVQDRIDFRNFSTDSDGFIVLSMWNINGVYLFQSQNVTYIFEEKGSYQIALTVFDDEGQADTIIKNLTVRKRYAYLTFLGREEATFGETLELSGILHSEDNLPLADMPINFYLVDELGYELIGSSFTNSSGVSTIYYTAVKTGKFKIWAVYEGDQKYNEIGILQDFFVREQNPHVLWLIIIMLLVIGLGVGIAKRRKAKRRKIM